jgi:hypothetical protein
MFTRACLGYSQIGKDEAVIVTQCSCVGQGLDQIAANWIETGIDSGCSNF